jgi:hypothetical protein
MEWAVSPHGIALRSPPRIESKKRRRITAPFEAGSPKGDLAADGFVT